MVARRSARSVASAAMISNPRPERTARISMTLSRPASTRTETAMAENASRAPVIQRTTRASGGRVTIGFRAVSLSGKTSAGRASLPSLRVRLVLRPRLVEGRELVAGGVGRDDLWELVERHLQASGVRDLRHQAHVGQRDLAAVRVGSRPEQLFQRLETVEDPVVVPGVDLGLVLA